MLNRFRRRKAKKKEEPKSAGEQVVELVVIVAVALGLAFGIQGFLVKPYRIPSESMVPTLTVGQRVLVNRLGNNFAAPKVGDVVVFHPPTGAETNECGAPIRDGQPCARPTNGEADTNFIKRVVGGPGDTIAIRGGRVIRNGRAADEPYARLDDCEAGADCDFRRAIRVPRDHFFMMGDNRGASDDSRFWGPVQRDSIIGGAFATYWPPRRIGLL